MDGLWIPIIVVVVLGFIAVSMALGSENRTKRDYERSKAEREHAEKERERAITVRQESEHQIAQERALALTTARVAAEQKIIEADRRSIQSVFEKVEQAGGLQVTFDELKKENGAIVPIIYWKWSPFGNAVLKIHRHQGTILDDMDKIKSQTDLIFVENEQSSGQFQDKDAKNGQTYNYYVFIEAKHMGYKAKATTQPIPSQFG